jgi:hypothetical protein
VVNGIGNKAEPREVLDNCVDVTVVFSRRIGVIESEVAATLIFGRYREIQTDRLCMTDMKETVGFWWETGLDATVKSTRGSICQQEISDVVTPWLFSV